MATTTTAIPSIIPVTAMALSGTRRRGLRRRITRRTMPNTSRMKALHRVRTGDEPTAAPMIPTITDESGRVSLPQHFHDTLPTDPVGPPQAQALSACVRLRRHALRQSNRGPARPHLTDARSCTARSRRRCELKLVEEQARPTPTPRSAK